MANGFYLVDENHRSITGELVVLKDQLHFCLEKAGFASKATKEHVKNYPDMFSQFMRANPRYVLPDSYKDEEIGAPSAVPAPEVAPVVEVPKTDKPLKRAKSSNK